MSLSISSSGYVFTDENDTVETYDTTGSLLSITWRNGYQQTLSYTNGQMESVTDSFGRMLSFTMSGMLLSSVTTPDGAVSYGYDSSQRLTTVTYPDSSSRSYQYGNSSFPNLITTVIDENGNNYVSLGYDSQGRATSSSFALGYQATTVTYNGVGSASIQDALGTARTYSFIPINGREKISAVNGPICQGCGVAKATTYDSAGYYSSLTDWNDNVTMYVYDDTRGLETSRTEAYGTPQARTISTTYHPAFRLPTEIDEPGRTTTFSYDGSGNLLTKMVKDTATSTSRTWTYSNYTAVGQPQTIDGPRTDVSDVTHLTYYPIAAGDPKSGQLQTITNALGHVTTINNYDASGRPLSITDPNGIVTSLVYNARGWLTSRQVASEVTQYHYYPTGQLQTVSWPDGRSATYTYDAAHRLTDVVDQLGNHVHYTLDTMGNRVGTDVYDAGGNHVQTHSVSIDPLNRPQQDIGAYSGEITTYLYDPNDNLTSVTDANNHQTLSYFDALNRVYQVTDPNNGVASYTHNALDQLTKVTDPRTLSTTYTVDAFGDVTQQSSPDSGTTTFTYDAAGNRITATDANGNTTMYSYDAINRLTKMTVADGRNSEYRYDQGGYTGIYNTGHLTTVADDTGTISFYYDAHGRVISKTSSLYGQYFTTDYDYNSTTGRLTSVDLPSGKTLNYSWTNGHITGIKVASTSLISNIVYQPFGAPKSWTLGNNETVARTFDLDGRMINSAVSTLTYDPASLVTGISLGNKSILSGSKIYGYDVLDRLNSYSSGSISIGYNYDANGNLFSSTDPAQSLSYSIASTSNRITSATKSGTTTPFSYDANGNLTDDGQQTYSYSMGNQLDSTGNNFFAFNGLYQRAYKASAGLTFFAYDEDGKIVGEYGDDGSALEETVWLGDMPVAVVEPSGNYFIHADHLNTPRQIDNASGQAVWAWDTETYGSDTSNHPNQDPRNSGTQFVYNLRMPGQYYDAESGLFQNNHRDYDPATGRYIESDPLGLMAGLNTYAYVGGNPVGAIDPLGLSSIAYNPTNGTATVYNGQGNVVGTFPAGNNTVSNSIGPYPDGDYSYAYYKAHSDMASPNSSYGSNGIFIFNRPPCQGCGFHSGRANSGGPKHKTLGCIRSTDDATKLVKDLNENGDPLSGIIVGPNPPVGTLPSVFGD